MQPTEFAFVVCVCVCVIINLTPLHWTRNKGLIPGKRQVYFLSSNFFPVALCLRVRPHKIFLLQY